MAHARSFLRAARVLAGAASRIDQLFNAIAGSLDRPGEARVEEFAPTVRRASSRAVRNGLLTFPDALRRGNRVDHLLAPRARVAREAHEVPLEIVRTALPYHQRSLTVFP